MGDQARQEIAGVVDRLVDEYAAADYVEDWDLDGLFGALEDIYPWPDHGRRDRLEPRPQQLAERARRRDRARDRREQELGEELMRALGARCCRCRPLARHLYDMDYCAGIHLRGFAKSTARGHKNRAFTLFPTSNTIWSDFSYHDLPRRGSGRGRERRFPGGSTPTGSSPCRARLYRAFRQRPASAVARPPARWTASPPRPAASRRRVGQIGPPPVLVRVGQRNSSAATARSARPGHGKTMARPIGVCRVRPLRLTRASATWRVPGKVGR
jgi:hypothetical protein